MKDGTGGPEYLLFLLPSLSLDLDFDLLFSGDLLFDLIGDLVGLLLLRDLDLRRRSLDLDRVSLPRDLDLLPLDLDLVLVFLPLDLDLDLRNRDGKPLGLVDLLLLLLLGLEDLLLVLFRLLDPFSPWGNMLLYSSAGSLLVLAVFLTTYPNLSSSTASGAGGAVLLLSRISMSRLAIALSISVVILMGLTPGLILSDDFLAPSFHEPLIISRASSCFLSRAS